MSESVDKHREASPERVRVAVLTISDTRTPETDTGGNAIVELMWEAGHEVSRREIVETKSSMGSVNSSECSPTRRSAPPQS